MTRIQTALRERLDRLDGEWLSLRTQWHLTEDQPTRRHIAAEMDRIVQASAACACGGQLATEVCEEKGGDLVVRTSCGSCGATEDFDCG